MSEATNVRSAKPRKLPTFVVLGLYFSDFCHSDICRSDVCRCTLGSLYVEVSLFKVSSIEQLN